jgi:two-component system NtrC family sensor kinase
MRDLHVGGRLHRPRRMRQGGAVNEGLARAERIAQALGVLFAETRIPVIALTRGGAFVSANAAALEQYGWSLEELLRMNIRDLLALDYPSLESDLADAIAGTPGPLNRRPHRRKDGSVLWVVPTAGPIEVDGQTLIVSVLKDVTAMIDAEAKARDATESSLRDRQLVLNAVVALLSERELRPALQILARSFGLAIGRSTSVWLPERKGSRTLVAVAWHDLSEEAEKTIRRMKVDLERERFSRLAWDNGVGYAVRLEDVAPGTFEYTAVSALGPGIVAPLMGRDGAHGILAGVPDRDADFARAVTLATTLGTFGGMVLEAVQLEARADVMWESASEQLSDGIALLGPDLRVGRVNSAMLRLLDRPETEVLGRRCVEVFTVCQERAPCPHQAALEIGKRSILEIVGRVSRRPLRLEVIPAQENDAGVAIIHVARDLTEERAIRTQLVTTDRLAGIGRLAAGVAHEINNPAAFVTVNLGVLRDRFAAGTARAQDVLAMLDESLNGMDRIREIVRDLKGLARERSIDLVDLGSVAQSALRMAAHETRGRAKVERVAEDGAVARVRGARIAQVALNLILNAAQALTAGRVENRITVRTRREGDRALLEVCDNGPGVDPRVASRIFDPFFTTREGSGGTGLGLWLARSIVDEEGGKLTFHEAPGGGACFVVDLPAAAATVPVGGGGVGAEVPGTAPDSARGAPPTPPRLGNARSV